MRVIATACFSVLLVSSVWRGEDSVTLYRDPQKVGTWDQEVRGG